MDLPRRALRIRSSDPPGVRCGGLRERRESSRKASESDAVVRHTEVWMVEFSESCKTG